MGCVLIKDSKFKTPVNLKIKRTVDSSQIMDSGRVSDLSVPSLSVNQGMVSKYNQMFPDNQNNSTNDCLKQEQNLQIIDTNTLWLDNIEQNKLYDNINFQAMDYNKPSFSQNDSNSYQGILLTNSQQSIPKPHKKVKFDLNSNHIYVIIQNEKMIKSQIRQKKLRQLDKRLINIKITQEYL